MSELVKIIDGEISVVPDAVEKLKQYREIKLKAEILEKELKQELKDAMEKYDIKRWSNDLFTASLIEATERKTVDTKRLREELPDIAEEYTRSSKVKSSLRVTFND